MNKIGRRIYYDINNGEVLVDTGEKFGYIQKTTIEQDFNTFNVLVNRVRDSVGILELEYGEYRQDFIECNGIRVNLDTGKLEFSYPNPNLPPDEQDIIYQKPLSEEVKQLKTEIQATQEAVDFLLMMGGM